MARLSHLLKAALAFLFFAVVGVALTSAQPNRRMDQFGQPGGANPGMPGGGNPGMPGMPGNVGNGVNEGTCSKCGKALSWTTKAPEKCPHCGINFNYVENGDGTKTDVKTGKEIKTNWVAIGVILALLFVGGVGWGVFKLVQASAAPKPKRKKKKKKPVREVEDDDDEDEDDRPRKRRRPRDDDDD